MRRPLLVLVVLLALALATVAAPPALALGQGDGFIVTLFGDWPLADAIETVRLAEEAGARHVAFLAFLEQDSPSASSVRWVGAGDGEPLARSPIAAKLASAIAEAHGRRLSTGIIPFLWEPGRSRRQFFWPADRAAWFASYRARMAELAAFAEAEGCDELVAASELSILFQDASGWRAIIREIRAGFSGHVTISATWPDYATIRFWDALDSVGVSAYFPLAASRATRSPTVLSWAWRWHALHLKAVARAWGKPLTFVEVGYPATDVAAVMPWDYAWGTRALDEAQQANCFEAFRRVFSRDPALRRFTMWGGQPYWIDAQGTSGKGFLPLGKAAEPVVRRLLAERAAP